MVEVVVTIALKSARLFAAGSQCRSAVLVGQIQLGDELTMSELVPHEPVFGCH